MFPSFITSVLFGENSPQPGTRSNEPITEKTTVRGSVHEAGLESYAFSGMQGWRVTMEDAHMVWTDIPVEGRQEPLRKGHVIFGVMDGHGGDFTSEFAALNFMKIFSANNRLKKYASMSVEDQSNVPGIECLRPLLTETFGRLDAEIRKQQNLRNEKRFQAVSKQQARSETPTRVKYERSGSTCCVVLVTPSHIICANAGDSRAILRRAGKVLPLSFDHKPNNAPELERINQASGFVKCKRVDGDLAVSRGLGDFTYKSNELLPVEHQKVIPNPEFVTYPRSKDDEFMILACDGIWDVASNEQCGSFIQSLLDEGEPDLGLICEEAIDTCLDKNSRDNMTIGMVSFQGCKIPTGGLGIKNVIWQRRAARQARQLQQSAKKVAARAASNVGLISEDTSSSKRLVSAVSTNLTCS
uniref:protein-serine/threonine phosphatase n=1 Tax=Pseudo-nitzschia australis TaxID=44445 RepID=A0A7S4AQP9_9STRA|mmetsp:Transcript_7974/g.17151  ORF Transcript_7974/g.17151 Transcript_7974/m.17151 type:complete len:413 (+) Transcript_7974:171-1409(+)|eukprot:CAMPEP_0168193398 /NCGR_PEP_ID=MMETSP0139_2-20121125/18585_1 /TAXON_ID=44445 /ORGANISM="Pseudo-nitzschia australis, Strain 10249 10 AB" /LENGTH=412 /DNA_ID=CAMNT_0008116751 /DNA_START=158 /DNA_END=1396 /DNA_ORIENTATION=-